MFLCSAFLASGCDTAAPEPEPTAPEPTRAVEQPATKPRVEAKSEPVAPVEPVETQLTEPVAKEPSMPMRPGGDPLQGHFTLEDATKGLKGKGKLVASIDTDKGKLDCTLYDDKAPLTVANFVGLARGIRPWKSPEGAWVERPAYDGTVFHRIIKGFMIQGGDPKGTGAGEPGYVIRDEIWPGAKHDQRGLICMANRGRNTNGAQFFILDAPAPHLDGGYTIFGKCGPDQVIDKLANVEVRGERPIDPPKIRKITIRRGG
jgi:peptidyl-prolyl cis-trans isomerase A (cyclophilin A)